MNKIILVLVGFMLTGTAHSAEITKVIIKAAREKTLAPVERSVFDKLRLNIGTANSVVLNSKARIPSFILKLDFNKQHLQHLIQSSAQLVDKYSAEPTGTKPTLLDKQLVAVTNFPKRHIGIASYFLVLGVVGINEDEGGTVVLTPSQPVQKGARLSLLNDLKVFSAEEEKNMSLVEFAETFELLDLRVGTVCDIETRSVDFGDLGRMNLALGDYELKPGMQIIRLVNLAGVDKDNDNILGIIEDGRKIPITVESKVANGRFVL
jgi:hypothetical protein